MTNTMKPVVPRWNVDRLVDRKLPDKNTCKISGIKKVILLVIF